MNDSDLWAWVVKTSLPVQMWAVAVVQMFTTIALAYITYRYAKSTHRIAEDTGRSAKAAEEVVAAAREQVLLAHHATVAARDSADTAREHMVASLSPLLVAEIASSGAPNSVDVILRNIGGGPAINIAGDASSEGEPLAGSGDSEELITIAAGDRLGGNSWYPMQFEATGIPVGRVINLRLSCHDQFQRAHEFSIAFQFVRRAAGIVDVQYKGLHHRINGELVSPFGKNNSAALTDSGRDTATLIP